MLAEAEAKTRAKGDAIADKLDDIAKYARKSFDSLAGSGYVLDDSLAKTSKATDRVGDSAVRGSSKVKEMGYSFRDAGMNAFILSQSLISVNHQIAAIGKGLNLKGALQEFRDQENAQIGLNAALDQQKRKTDDSINSYKQWARETEKVTTSSAEMNLMLAQQALAFGLNDKQAQRAVKNAISLAAATDRTARELIKVTIRLEAGSAEMLGEYIPTLVGIKEESARVVEAQRKLAEMHGIAEEKAKSFDGRIKGLDNSFNRFQYTVGRSISEVLDPFIKVADDLIDRLAAMPQWLNKTIVIFVGTGAVIISVTASVVIAALAWKQLSIAITNAGYAATITSAKFYALRAAVAGVVAYGFFELGQAIAGAGAALDEFNSKVKESSEHDTKWAQKFRENTDSIIKSTEKITDREQRKSKLGEELANAKKEASGYVNAVKGSQNNVNELNTRWNRFIGNKLLEASNIELEVFNNKSKIAKDRVDQLQMAFDAIKPVEQDQKILDEISKLNKELEKQRYSFGKTNEEVRIYEIQLMGATKAMLAASVQTNQLNVEIKKLRDTLSSAKSLVQSIKDTRIILDLEARGATDFEKQLAKLESHVEEVRNKLKIGFTEKDLNELGVAFQEVRRELDKTFAEQPQDIFAFQAKDRKVIQLTNALEKLSAQYETMKRKLAENAVVAEDLRMAEEALNKARKEVESIKIYEKRNELIKEGAEVTKQFLTPLEKYYVEARKLRTLLVSGTISQDTYNRAIEDANKKLEDTEKQAEKTRKELERLDAVDFFSLEAKDRVDKYLEALKEMFAQQRKLEKLRQERTNVPLEVMTPANAEMMKNAIDAALAFVTALRQELSKGIGLNLWNFFVPKFNSSAPEIAPMPREVLQYPQAPMPREVLPTPDFSGGRGRGAGVGPTVGINPYTNILSALSAPADNTVVQDRKEMIALLKSMDGTMKSINDKPVSVLTVAQIQS